MLRIATTVTATATAAVTAAARIENVTHVAASIMVIDGPVTTVRVYMNG